MKNGHVAVWKKNYEPINFITMAIINIVAKKPKDTTNPIMESDTSFVFDWTFFSNSFIKPPPDLFYQYRTFGKKNPHSPNLYNYYPIILQINIFALNGEQLIDSEEVFFPDWCQYQIVTWEFNLRWVVELMPGFSSVTPKRFFAIVIQGTRFKSLKD